MVVGSIDYKLTNSDQIITQNAWHQDQITILPKDATVIASSDFCKYAGVAYGKKALTWQFHPEFSSDFMSELIKIRSNILPSNITKNAVESLTKPLSTDYIINQIIAFLIKIMGKNHRNFVVRV